MSWGSDDNAAYASYDQSLSKQYLVTPTGHQGITFVASSGDAGVASFPSTSPNVLSVGGTDLYLNSNGTISNETAWTPQTGGGQTWSGGGGVSQEFAGRKVPDVSYNAGVGMAVYDTFGPNHGWVGVGGTSAGAPQWAALIAIANQGRAMSGLTTLDGASQTLKALYAAPAADFHDITQGSTQFQTAGVGYDLATGLGTPVANQLIQYLAAYGGSGSTGGTTSLPAAPGNFTASVISSSQVNLNWTTAAGATSYNVYVSNNGMTSLYATLGSTATSANVTGLSASTPYSFEVTAVNSAGSTATNWASVTTPAAAVTVTVPTNVVASASSSTVAKVSWSTVTGATGYYVYQWNGTQGVRVATVDGSLTSANIGNQTAGVTEYFYVTAYNATSSASSGWVSVVMPAAASTAVTAPTNVTAKATSTTAGTLSWTASSNASGYRIYYWNGATSVLLGSVGSTTTSVTISGMAPGSTYYFYVTAYNSTSTASSSSVAMTTPLTAALKPSDIVFGQTTAKHRWRTA